MAYKFLLYEVEDAIATITLNRPDQRNALNGEMLAELVDAFQSVRDDDQVRAAVLTGAAFPCVVTGEHLRTVRSPVLSGRTDSA